MFGVIDFKNSMLFLYSDLSSSISLFFKINQGKDISFEPNINNSLSLLSCQNNLYQVSLEFLHLSPSTILNIAILRDDECKCSIESALLNLSKEEIEALSFHYKIEKIIYKKKKCSLCNLKFKIWDENENCGYKGCIYNPCYYQIITQDSFKDSDMGWGNKDKIDEEIKKLNFNRSKIFFIGMRGGTWGLYLSKNPIPENLNQDSFLCWSCINDMINNLIFIWGH